MDWMDLALGLLGGLAVFLYGASIMSDSLQEVAGDRMKSVLAKMTTNPLAGLLTGCLVTTVLDSSSLTIILVIGLVHAGALSFQQSLAVILGSNIGTTISSQLFAISVDKYSPILLVAGLLAILLGRSKPIEQYGRVVFSIGLVFFGLHLMGEAMKPLAESRSFEAWMHNLDNPIRGVLAGAGGTALIQSSSAMMGIIIKLAGTGVMSLPAGVSVMLGAEVGTCLDTLLASMGRNREAVRAGVFHLCFNIVTVALGLLLYQQLAQAAAWLPSGGSVSRQIANAHVLFNTAGALLFLPLVPFCAKGLEYLLPSQNGAPVGEPQPEAA